MEKNTTRQISNQNFYNESDNELKCLRRVRFWWKIIFEKRDFEEKIVFKKRDFEEKKFLKSMILNV